jgi:hypothetical protein
MKTTSGTAVRSSEAATGYPLRRDRRKSNAVSQCPLCSATIPEGQISCPRCRLALGKCESCGSSGAVALVVLKENVSYIVGRRERTFEGFACLRCLNSLFGRFETRTLLGTWWGVIGLFRGPVFLVLNVIEYVPALIRFLRLGRRAHSSGS